MTIKNTIGFFLITVYVKDSSVESRYVKIGLLEIYVSLNSEVPF